VTAGHLVGVADAAQHEYSAAQNEYSAAQNEYGSLRHGKAAIAMQHTRESDDWQTLRLAPFWVLSALAGRSQQFDPLEDAAFWHCMDVAAAEAAGVARDALHSVIADRESLVQDFEQDGRPIASGLGATVTALATLPPLEAAHFTDVLFTYVATGLARARGPYGSGVTRDDAETLSMIAAFLEIEVDEVNPLNLSTPV
jgi:hypothetical protein